MKTKLKTTLALLAAFCGLQLVTNTAFAEGETNVATTPVAVWEGASLQDGKSFTVDGKTYTLHLNGNEMTSGGYVQIKDNNAGVYFTITSGGQTANIQGMTVIARVANFTASSADDNKALITFKADGHDTAAYKNLVGFGAMGNGRFREIWGGANNYTTSSTPAAETTEGLIPTTAPGNIGFSWKRGGTAANRILMSGSTTMTTGLGSSQEQCNLTGAYIGGRDLAYNALTSAPSATWTYSGDARPAAGLRVYAIAVFADECTSATMTAYKFPSQADLESAGTMPTVAYWDKDFLDGSTKGGYTVSYGAGATRNDDGTISLAQQGTSGTRTDGVVVNFYDAAGATALSGYQMTVIVKYSGLTCSSQARTVLFSTKWGTNTKDTTEVVIVRTWDGKLAMGYGIAAGDSWKNQQMCDTATFPTDGLMMISCSGSGGYTGTRVGFAPLQNDGTYGDFVEAGFKGNVTYSDKPFYGIKIGGTQGGISDMTRPGMKVEGVAVIKGVTSTMKKFKYLFPNECVARYDWPQSGNLTTTATTLINNMPLKAVTNAVYAGKMQSVDKSGSMLTACFKKFSPAGEDPTSMTLQYQHLDPSNSKAVNGTIEQSGSNLTIKRSESNGRYSTPANIGTDDANWTTIANYNVSTLSVYVPASKTATLTGGTVNWENIPWTGGAPTANDFVLLKVTAATTVNIASTSAMAGCKVVSGFGVPLTLKYTGVPANMNWDFSTAEGGVAFDLSEIGPDLAKCAVAGAPYSFWLTKGGGMVSATLPSVLGYTFATETVSGIGTRVVVTAPSTAQFGSVNINFAGGRNSVTFNDDAKVGTYTTMQGGYPVIGTSWNDLEAKNYTGTATKYIDTDGTVKTDGNISVTVTQCNNPYTTGQGDEYKHTITFGYIDDGGSPIVSISNIPFAKYRVILYRATDSGDTFSAAQIGTTSSNTKIYYGPTKTTAGGVTLIGTSEVDWGLPKQAGYTEGMNYIVSDVLEGTAGSATAYIYSHKHAGRAGVAAIQIVEVGSYVEAADTHFITEGAPAKAMGATVKADNTFFGTDDLYSQTVGGRAAQAIEVQGASADTYKIFGGLGEVTGGTLSKDIWMEVYGGTYNAIFGGSDASRWKDSSAHNITGNIVLEVGGNTIANHVYGGNYKEGFDPTVNGNVSVVVKDSAVVKGTIVGAGVSVHSKTGTYTGNTSVLVKNVQSDNTAGALIGGDSSDYIIGGGVYGTNTGSKDKVTGNSSVTIDLASAATGSFVKHIVGGGFACGDNDNGEAKVGGNSSVTVNAPPAVTFTGNIYAGGWTTTKGSSTVTGTATVTLAGGTYQGNIIGGTATGTKTLNVTDDIVIKANGQELSGFDAFTVAENKKVTLDAATDAALTFALPNCDTTIEKTGAGKLTLGGLLDGVSFGFAVKAGTLVATEPNSCTFSVDADATVDIGTNRTVTVVGASQGTVQITLTAEEKATLDAKGSIDAFNVSGDDFNGTVVAFDHTGAGYEVEFSYSEGKIVVTKKEGARQSPFHVTNPTNETWTIAGWTDNSTPALDVRPEDWDHTPSANIKVEAEQEKVLKADRALPLGTLTVTNAGTFAVSFTNVSTAVTATEMILSNTGTLTVSATGEGTVLTSKDITIDNSGTATITGSGANAISVETLNIGNANSLTLTGDIAVSSAINDSASTGATTIDFAPGATPITAGANTILNTVGTGAYTIGANKKLTVKDSGLSVSQVSNSGTLVFDGGSAETPLAVTGNANLTATLAAGAYVKNTVDGNQVHNITGLGANASSVYALGKASGGVGMTTAAFTNLTLVSDCAAGEKLWIERMTLENVRFVANTEIYLADMSPTILSLSGAGAVTKNGDRTLTINCDTPSTYEGPSSVPFTIGGTATVTLTGNYTGALTVNDGAHVALGAAAHPSSITVNGTGVVEFLSGCTVDFGTTIRALPTGYQLNAGVTVKATQTSEEFMAGSVQFTGLPNTISSITMTCADRVVVELPVSEGTATYTDTSTKISGPATWLDYTFTKADLARRQSEDNDHILNCGTAGENVWLTYDTNYKANNSYKTENGALLAKSTPYRRMNDTAAWPENYTVAVYGNVPDVEKGCLIGFGSSTQGNKYLAIVRGATSNEILLMQGTDNSTAASVIATMAAENATSSKHLIVFINDGTNFKIYCDGTKIQEVASSTLGEGIQIGSVHGGVAPGQQYKGKDYTGITRISEIDDEAKRNAVEIGMIRVFNKVISDTEMDALAEKFSYISHGGLYDRTISTAAENLKSTDAWVNHQTEVPTDLPVTNQYESVWYRPSVDITTTAASTLTVNENAAFDKMTFGGAGTLTLVSDGTHSSEMSGALKVESPIVITYGALDLTKSPTKITTGGSITFDLTGYPTLERVFEWTKVRQLTGLMDSEGGVSIKSGTEPTGPNTVSECYYDGTQYWLAAKPARDAGTVYLIAGTETLDDDTVVKTAGGADTLLLPGDTVVVTNSETLTLSQTIAIAGLTVQSGTLKLTAGTALPITVESGATLDLNGVETVAEANNFVVTLNGGTLTNSGTNKGILKSLTLGADSYVAVDVDKAIWMQNEKDKWGATTLALDNYKLTKNGAGRFAVVTTSVTGTGTIDVEGGDLYVQENSNFGAATVMVGAAGTFTVRSDNSKTATVANIEGVAGGKLVVNDTGAFTGFNLSGTIELAGTGSYGTITNQTGAVAKVGNRRNLTFAGAGTVDVTMQDSETIGGQANMAFTLGEDASTTVGTITYDGADVTAKCTKSTNTFTVNTADCAAKDSEHSYLTLPAAIRNVTAGSTITVLADIATGDDGIAVDKNITLDGAGCELTGTGFTGTGTLTIIGGRIGVDGLPTAYALQGGEYPAAKVTGEGAWTVASGYHLVDIYSTEALTYSKQVAIGSSPAAEDEKSYPVKPKGGSEVVGAIVVKTSDLVEKGIVSEGATAAQVSAALGEEGANHYPTWQNVVLGLDNKIETSIPYPAPVQGTSTTQVSLKLGSNVSVDTTTGAKVTYKVKTKGATGEWTTGETEYGYGDTAEVDLPTTQEGVKYYKFDVIVTPAK